MKTRVLVLIPAAVIVSFLATGCASKYLTGAKVHIQHGEYSEAVPLLKKELGLNAGNVEAYLLLGKSYCEIGDFKSAAEAYGKAEALVAAEANTKWAEVLEKDRMYYWQKAFEAGRIPLNEALNLIEEGKKEESAVKLHESIDAYDNCDRLFDRHPKNQFMIGFAYENLEETENAFRAYEKALAVKRDDLATNNFDAETPLTTYTLKYAALAMRTERYEEARENLEELAAEDPENTELLYALGVILLDMDEYDEAANYFTKVLEKEPDNGKATLDLGNLYLKKEWTGRDARKAIEILTPLLETEEHKEDYQVYASLGNAYKDVGDNKKAAEYYQKAQELYDKLKGGE